MTPAELDIICQIDQLPSRTSSRQLIGLLGSDTLRARVFDIFGGMEKHQAFMRMMARKKNLEKSGEGTSSPSWIVAHKTPTQSMNPALQISDTEKPLSAPVKASSVNAPANDSKKKLPRDKGTPMNKKRKITGPVLFGPLDPLIHVAERLQYNPTPEEKIPFKRMSPGEASDMAYELIARASVCMNYAAGSTKSLLTEELDTVRQDLEASQKKNAELTRHLEEIMKIAEDNRAKVASALTQAQDDLRQLKRTSDDLKLDFQKATSQNQALMKERDALVAVRDKLTTENLSLGDDICNERLTGFEQGIAQCRYFFGTPLSHDGFDIMKIVVNGQLLSLSTLDEDEAAAIANASPSGAQAIAEVLFVTTL
ncbi:hypothetical protein VIGAN_11078000 [Vigna angularis var. angularis]|nr:uncharacterized protein LOC108344879 isoform X1 [Vigna angularis]BAU01527.1 hypothetical protein VIGAN_11078000 [Vigna angularis var. angularis]